MSHTGISNNSSLVGRDAVLIGKKLPFDTASCPRRLESGNGTILLSNQKGKNIFAFYLFRLSEQKIIQLYKRNVSSK